MVLGGGWGESRRVGGERERSYRLRVFTVFGLGWDFFRRVV